MSLTSYRTAPPRGIETRIGSRVRGAAAAVFALRGVSVLGGPGGDRLSQALRLSTMGAEGFNGRVRNGIGFWPLARATRPAKHRAAGGRPVQMTEDRGQIRSVDCATKLVFLQSRQ